MLSPLARVAAVFRDRRKFLRWSQRRVAGQVGCSQSYLAQVETGVRPVSRQLAEKLERLLGVSGRLQGVRFLRGRPPLSAVTRAVMKQIRQARGRKPSQYLPLGKPKYARPERARGLKSALGKLAGPLCGDERFWRNLNSIRFDSGAEKQLVRWLAMSGAQLTGVSWGRLGCSLPVMDGSNGRDAGRRAQPTFLLQDGDMAVAFSPQRCVRAAGGYLWPDLLMVIAREGRRTTAVVEVDGAPWHADKAAEAFRDADLGVSVLHLDAAEVGGRGTLRRILDWARQSREGALT